MMYVKKLHQYYAAFANNMPYTRENHENKQTDRLSGSSNLSSFSQLIRHILAF